MAGLMKATVMIVDDEAAIRFFVKSVLEDEGCTVFEAGDAATLRGFLRSRHPMRWCWI